MTVRARGRVGDRPFARFVYATASKSFRGDLVLSDDGREYRVAWHESLLVAAHSPLPADSVGRVALNAGLLTRAQLSELLRQLPGQPEISAESSALDAIARLARLDDTNKKALARRTLLQHAIRIFALPNATFELHDTPTLSPAPGIAPIPVRTVIFRGLVGHYSQERLREELAVVAGARLKLASTDQNARVRLGEYGFTKGGLALVQHLARSPGTLEDLEAALPDIDIIELLATVYALLSADDVVAAIVPQSRRAATVPPAAATRPPTAATRPPRAATSPSAAATSPPRATSPTPLPSPTARPVTRPTPQITTPIPRRARATGPVPGATSGRMPRAPSNSDANTSRRMPRAPSNSDATTSGRMPRAPSRSDATTTAPSPRASTQSGTDGSRAVPLGVGRRARAGTEAPDAEEIQALLDDMEERAATGCSHYELLGVAADASDADIRSAYFYLAKKLHPDRVRGVGLNDKLRMAQHLFASINGAFNAINAPDKRARYDATLASGGTGDRARDQAAAEAKVTRLLSAEEHFFRGERALRTNRFAEALAEFREAADKNPDEPTHHASLAYALWAAAPEADKKKARVEAEKGFRRALELAPKCVLAHFYRGQIAAASGDSEAALRAFRKVIDLEPSHREAELQVRLLESRKNKKDSGGLLDRFRRR